MPFESFRYLLWIDCFPNCICMPIGHSYINDIYDSLIHNFESCDKSIDQKCHLMMSFQDPLSQYLSCLQQCIDRNDSDGICKLLSLIGMLRGSAYDSINAAFMKTYWVHIGHTFDLPNYAINGMTVHTWDSCMCQLFFRMSMWLHCASTFFHHLPPVVILQFRI